MAIVEFPKHYHTVILGVADVLLLIGAMAMVLSLGLCVAAFVFWSTTVLPHAGRLLLAAIALCVIAWRVRTWIEGST